MSDRITLERRYATTQDKLWRALTTPHLLAEWLQPNTMAKAAVGERFQFRIPATEWWNGVTDSKILVHDPMTRFALTFEPTGKDAEVAPKVEVSFTLTPMDGGVHLRLDLDGFRADQTQLRAGATGAWSGMLTKLGTVVEGAA